MTHSGHMTNYMYATPSIPGTLSVRLSLYTDVKNSEYYQNTILIILFTLSIVTNFFKNVPFWQLKMAFKLTSKVSI